MEAPPTRCDIFLSHSGKQKGFVTDLEQELSSMGYSVFFDKNDHSLPPGQPFPPLIFSAAKTCKLGIVVLSDDFLTSYWPMLELCVFAERLLSGDVSGPSDSFTLLPLFYKLSPEDIKTKNKVDGWIAMWMEFERFHGHERMTAAKCKEAVMKVLAPRNGIVLDSSRQGDVSYIEEVARKIKLILPRRAIFSDPGRQYSGRQRLCQMILDEFGKLEAVHPFTSDLHGHVLGMYGVPGSGKSTLCRFLCDHDAVFEEFGENMVYLQLPTTLDPHHVAADSLVLVQQYSKLIPRHKHLASMDLIQARNKLYHARIRHKMFLVLDNISTSNQEHYRTILQDIMSAAILPLGSKIMLVAQTHAILEDTMLEIERYSTYKHAIIEVPYMTEEEAREIIRNCCQYSGMAHPVFSHSLHFFKRNIPSCLFIPFIFEQIGVLLRENYSSDAREPKLEVEMLLKIVSKGKKDAVRDLVDINFKKLPEELQILFLDMALFIIPAGCSQIDEAALILSRMNGATDTDANIVKMEIKKLRKHCALSITEKRIQIHDIFLEYAKNISANSTSYVNGTWSRILGAAPRSSPGPATVYLNCSEARIINIGDGFMDVDVGDRDINLHLEIGAKAKAVTVRSRDNRSTRNCSLLLSGDLSSLVWLQMENLQQVSISLTARGTNLCNLDRLELRNSDKKDIVILRNSCKKRKRISSLLDFIGRPIIQYWKGMSVSWPFTPSLPWVTYPLASYTDVMRSLVISGRTSNLRVLILVNAGVRSLEDVCRGCPQLEELEVSDEHHQLMSVSIGGSTPKLKRLVIGKRLQYVRERAKYTYKATRSSELVLQLGECRELEEVSLDVSSFDRVEVMSPLPSSRLRQFGLLNDRKVEVMGMALVSPGSLSLLRSVVIYCKKVETLAFNQHCLPSLEELRVDCCNNLTHVSISQSCLSNLQSLAVRCCNKLHVIEGLENLVKEQLQSMSLEFLPHLQCELRFGGEHLQGITVTDCPGVKISYHVLVSSERLKRIDLEGKCTVILMGNHLHCIVEELETDGISEHQMDEDVDGTEKFSPDENIIAAATMQNESSNTPGHNLSIQYCPQVSPINLQNRLTFWQVRDIKELRIDGSFEHLQEIEGIQHLRMLERLYLSNLRSLTRVSGTWPPSIEGIRFEKCPRLQEVPRLDNTPKLRRLSCIECLELKSVEGSFRQLIVEEYFEIELVGCESMETFPMENAIEELGRSCDEEYCPLGFVRVAPMLRVRGSKFARVEVMEEWLERAEWNSHLWVAALDCLSWEYVVEGAINALDALVRYFSSGAPSPQIISEYPHQYHRIILSLEFSYLYLTHQVLPSASHERLLSLERIMGLFQF